MTRSAPMRFNHDCDDCISLGMFEEFDVYYCPKSSGGSLIGRYSSIDSKYSSHPLFLLKNIEFVKNAPNWVKFGIEEVLARGLRKEPKRCLRKECWMCSTEELGCGCDGSMDDGCFLCTPEKHTRPECSTIDPALHNWSGWPGAVCLKCGAEDARERCVGEHPFGQCPEHEASESAAASCKKCCGTGAVYTCTRPECQNGPCPTPSTKEKPMADKVSELFKELHRMITSLEFNKIVIVYDGHNYIITAGALDGGNINRLESSSVSLEEALEKSIKAMDVVLSSEFKRLQRGAAAIKEVIKSRSTSTPAENSPLT